jgi:acyl carrier protein
MEGPLLKSWNEQGRVATGEFPTVGNLGRMWLRSMTAIIMSDVQRAILDTIRAKTGKMPDLEQTWWEMEVDSLTMAEITLELESRLQIYFDDRVLDTENVSDLVDLVQEMKPECSSSPDSNPG